MSLKEKLRVILNQRGAFKCPNGPGKSRASVDLPEGALERVLADLQKRGSARPGTVKTLASSINNLFQKSLSSQQLATLIDALKSRAVVSITGTKVSYGPIAGA